MKTSLFSGFAGFLNNLGIEEAVRVTREMGFDGGEMYPCEAVDTIETARELKAALDAQGMVCSCYSIGMNLVVGDGVEAIARLKHCVDLAAELGSPYLHHTLGSALKPLGFGAPSFDEVFDEVVRRAREVADYAADKGVRCLYEDQGYYFNGCERMERFLYAMKRDNIGICADLGNIFFVDEAPEDFVGRFANVTYHVHVKDYLRKEGVWPGEGWHTTRSGAFLRDVTVGHGIVDFQRIFRMLIRAGYDGFYSMESSSPEEFMQSNKRGLANIKRFYDNAAREIAEMQQR